MAEIRLDKVSKRYGQIAVLRDIDLTIRDGEFFTFVGPSGCGKSTLLNMIAGLDSVSGGTILFDGVPVNDLAPAERDVAMVFQSYALYPHMNVRDNLAFPLKMKKVEREEIEREVWRTAALLGIGDLLGRKPRQLSGGQRQRVALGRAIIRRPRVFLMDEPLSNLDARLRVEMRGELKMLHRELNITTIYVTHDQEEALGLSERIAVLHGGSVEQCGTPREVFFSPANLFVGGFIGSPPLNVIPGKVRSVHPPEIDCNGHLIQSSMDLKPETEDVVLGIRPDDLTVSDESSPRSIEVIVSVIEPAGPINWVEVDWQGVRLKGKAGADLVLKPGDRAFADFSRDNVLIFEAVSGRNLRPVSQGTVRHVVL
jgi:multiple sugar transport system ATP-binding protein